MSPGLSLTSSETAMPDEQRVAGGEARRPGGEDRERGDRHRRTRAASSHWWPIAAAEMWIRCARSPTSETGPRRNACVTWLDPPVAASMPDERRRATDRDADERERHAPRRSAGRGTSRAASVAERGEQDDDPAAVGARPAPADVTSASPAIRQDRARAEQPRRLERDRQQHRLDRGSARRRSGRPRPGARRSRRSELTSVQPTSTTR